MKSLLVIILLLIAPPAHADALPKCAPTNTIWTDCFGEITLSNGDNYAGNFINGKWNGNGVVSFTDSTYYL
jgi:hypothetical protein